MSFWIFTGLQGLLAFVGFVILGAGVLAGAVIAAAWWVGTDLLGGHPADCDCDQCQRLRQKAWDKAKKRNPEVNKPRTGYPENKKKATLTAWISTAELRIYMHVIGKDRSSVYVVQDIKQRDYGVVVILVNVITEIESWVNVPTANMQKPIWLVHDRRRAR